MLRLSCPRCRLTITPRVVWLTPQHCPRCIARARVAVALRTSPDAGARYGADELSVPTRGQLSTGRDRRS